MNEDGGKLVGSGSFKVDAARAAASLRRRQLQRTFWRPALFIRLACACGAKGFSITKSMRQLVVRFDGAAVPPDVLREPFSRLAGGADDPVLRWFAWAVLHSGGPGLAVTAASGRGKERAAFKYDADGRAEAVPPGKETETAITVRWGFFTSAEMDYTHPAAWPLLGPNFSPFQSMLQTGDPAPFPLRFSEQHFSHEQAPWERRKRREGTFRLVDGRRTFCRIAEGPAKVRVSVLGTRVAVFDLPEVPLPVEAGVDEPGLELDASLDAPLQGPGLDAAVARGRTAAGSFVLELLDRHARAMRLAGAWLVKDRRARRAWVKAMGLVRGDEDNALFELLGIGPAPRGSRSGDGRRVLEAARMTLFLRAAAERSLRARAVDARDPLRDALWKAPLFFDGRGRPLSLDDAGAADGVPAMTSSFDPPAPNRAKLLWVLSPLDAIFLKKRFRDRPRGD